MLPPDVKRHYESSTELCEAVHRLTGGTILLSMSCGKDAVCAWLRLRELGFGRIVPFYMWSVPGLEFVEQGIRYYEDFFKTEIWRVPQPSAARKMRNLVFQSPERAAIIEQFVWPHLKYQDVEDHVRLLADLPARTYVALGTRTADSPIRRANVRRYGSLNPARPSFFPIYDWRIAQVRETIRKAGVKLTVDYKWFGRSFDGLDYRFLEPIKRNAPRDYARILEYYPLAELEIFRRTLRPNHGT